MSDKFGEGRDPYLYPGLGIMRSLCAADDI